MATTFTTDPEILKAEQIYNQIGELPPLMPRPGDEHYDSYIRSYLADTKEWCEVAYDRALSEVSADPEIGRREHYLKMLWGHQWEQSRASYKPSPVINRTSKWFWESLANLSDIKLNFSVTTGNKDFRDTAKNLETISQSNYRGQRGLMALLFKMMHAELCLGFTKVSWNKERDDVCYTPSGADTILPILGNPLDIQQCSGVIETQWKPITWFYENYSVPFGSIEPEEPPQALDMSPGGRVKRLSYNPEYVDPLFRNSPEVETINRKAKRDPFGVAPLQLFWFRDPSRNLSGREITMGKGNWSYRVAPFDRLYPFGRLIATVGIDNRKILYDNTNPHWHGKFPYSPLRLAATPWTWAGMSRFRDLDSIQVWMNVVLADALYILRQIANPTCVTREGALAEVDWLTYFPGKPMAKLVVQDRNHSIPEQLQWVRPDPSAISAAPTIYEIFKRAFDEISGSIDVTKITNKKQMPGEGSIDAARELQQAIFRIQGIFVEDSVRQEAELALSDCVQFYTRARSVAILGPENAVKEYFDYDPKTLVPAQHSSVNPHVEPQGNGLEDDPFRRGNAFIKQFACNVGTGSSVPSQRRATAQLAEAMRGARDLDHEHYIEMLQAAGYDLPDSQSIMENLVKEAQMMPAPPPRHGRPRKAHPAE